MHDSPASDVVVLTPERVGEEKLRPLTPLPSPAGVNNDKPDIAASRVIEGASYRDCSTVLLLPMRTKQETLHHKVADAYKNLIAPMNQKFTPIRLAGFEIADAYNQGIQMIQAHPELSKWKFILTMESDNTPPPTGLIQLLETIYSGPWAAVAGLYWTKGEMGMPMIYGNPRDPEVHFRPQPPIPGEVQECRGVAMGFTLWDAAIFRDERLKLEGSGGWFRTAHLSRADDGIGTGTQDLDFCARACALGYRFASDNRVRVGHVQFEASNTHPAGFVW